MAALSEEVWSAFIGELDASFWGAADSPCSEDAGAVLAWLAGVAGGSGFTSAPELGGALAVGVLALDPSDETGIASVEDAGAGVGAGFGALPEGIVPDAALGAESVIDDCVASTVDPAVKSECSIGGEACFSNDGVCDIVDTACGAVIVVLVVCSASALESDVCLVSGLDTFAG